MLGERHILVQQVQQRRAEETPGLRRSHGQQGLHREAGSSAVRMVSARAEIVLREDRSFTKGD